MTVVLGLRCVDGVVLASDSQATEADSTRTGVQKVFRLADNVVWAGSGSGAVIRECKHEFEKEHVNQAIRTALQHQAALVRHVKPVFKRYNDAYLPIEHMPFNPPVVDLIFAGILPDDEGKPFLVELDRHCMVTDYSEIGIHAIGSGSAMAQMSMALTSHYTLTERPVEYGKLVAWRALNAVIQTSAKDVGPPIQMMTVTASGAEVIDEDELRNLEQMVGGWQQLEVDALRTMMGEATDESEPQPLPEVVDVTGAREEAEA